MTVENTLKPLHVPPPTTEEYGGFKVTREYVPMDEVERNIKHADMVRVVRCRDCKHYNTEFGGGCAYFCIGDAYGQEPENMSDGFCAWSERR